MKIIKMLLSFIKLSFKEYHTYFVVLIFNTLVLSAQTIFAAYTLSLIISLIETNNFSSSLNYAILIVFVEVLLLFLKLLCQKLLSKHQAIMEVKIDQSENVFRDVVSAQVLPKRFFGIKIGKKYCYPQKIKPGNIVEIKYDPRDRQTGYIVI